MQAVPRTGRASNEGDAKQALHHAAWKGHGCDHILVNNDIPSLAKGSVNIASGLLSAMFPGTPSSYLIKNLACDCIGNSADPCNTANREGSGCTAHGQDAENVL